jgi:hypothetical protein
MVLRSTWLIGVLLVLQSLLVRPYLQCFSREVDTVCALLHCNRTKEKGPRRRGPSHL